MKPSQLGGNAGGLDNDGLPSFVRKGKGGDGKRAGEKGGGGSRGSWAGLIHSADLVGEDIKNYKPCTQIHALPLSPLSGPGREVLTSALLSFVWCSLRRRRCRS
jgi:hypothetical protein